MNIDKLIIDRYFDIYNRNGFEYIVNEKIKNKCIIYLIDFDNIKSMNSKIGYNKVNELFKKSFHNLKSYYIIGRAFSGDEIFFLSEDINDNIDKIVKACNENKLYFSKWISLVYNNEPIDIFLEKMIENLK